MTGKKMKSMCRARYGHGWQKKIAEGLEINPSTVRRLALRDTIPRYYELAIYYLVL
jgi:hypothetical protein